MKTILEYKIDEDQIQEIKVPIGSKILGINILSNIPFVSVLVPNTDIKRTEILRLLKFAEGHLIDNKICDYCFLGSYPVRDVCLVYVFYNCLDR